MPQVQTYDQPQVRVQALPNVRQQVNVTSADFGGAQAQALREAGQDVGKAAERTVDLAVKRQEEHNKAAVWQAYTSLSNQRRDYLYGENGVMNKTGADAIGATKKSAVDIGSIAEKISNSLQNDEQRRLFKDIYTRDLDNTLDGLSRHEAQQRKSYQDQMAGGVIKSVQQDVANRWNDPTFITKSAELAVLAMSGNMQSKGMPQEMIDAETSAIRSGVWKSALEQAVAKSPLQAEEIFKAHRDKMTGSDAADVEKMLRAPVLAAKASMISTQVMTPSVGLPQQVASKITTQAMSMGVDPTMALTIARLENAKGDPNAENPNSSAHGIYQFIDSTWAAEGGSQLDRGNMDKQIELGIKHMKRNQDALRSALGREPTPAEVYLAHQQGIGGAKALISAPVMQTALSVLTSVYKGDAAKARDAIVNNGGRVDMAASQFVALWDSKYAKRSGIRGADNMPLEDQLTAAKALAGDDQDLQKLAVAEVIKQRTLQKQLRQDQEEQAMERIYGHVLKTGGYVGADPKDLAQLDNKTLLDLQSKAKNVETNWAFYDKFMAMSPAEKKGVPLQTLIGNLSKEQLQAAIKQRNEGDGGESKTPWIETRAKLIQAAAQEAGIESREKELARSPEKAGRYQALSSYMNKRMDAYREKNGVEMPEAEFRKEAAMAVTRVVVEKGTFRDTKANVFELNGQKIVSVSNMSDVPSEMRSMIETTLRSRGKKVNDDNVLMLSRAWVAGDVAGARMILEGAE